jgi:hypothetical protein
MGVDGQPHAPAALPPGKTRYPLYRRLGGPHGQSGRARKGGVTGESRNVRRGALCFVKALALLALRAAGGLGCHSF